MFAKLGGYNELLSSYVQGEFFCWLKGDNMQQRINEILDYCKEHNTNVMNVTYKTYNGEIEW